MSRFLSLGLTTAFTAITLLVFPTALDSTAAAQVREEPTDPPSMKIAAHATSAGATGRVRVTLTITARETVPDAVLEIASAGAVRLERPPAFKALTPGEAYHPGILHNRRVSRTLGTLRPGVPLTVRLRLSVPADGRGFVAIAVQSNTDPHLGESQILYIGRVGSSVLSNNFSLLDLDADMLRANARKKSVDDVTLQRQLKDLYESGASSPSTPTKRTSEQSHPLGQITVTGLLLFTDRDNRTHPVKAATVQVYDSDPGGEDDPLGSSVLTDDDGRFRITVSNADEDGTGQDVFIRARAEGPNVRVRQWEVNTVYAIKMEKVEQDIRDGERVELTPLIAGNSQDNNVAFEIHQAVEQMARYIALLPRQGHGPVPEVTVRYPRKERNGGSSDHSSYGWDRDTRTGTVYIGSTDGHDWDNIQHEYGHHVQRHFGIGNNPSLGHGGGEDLCNRLHDVRGRPNYGQPYGKADGINLAYAESWPTVFAIISQREQGLEGIPHVGDTGYRDVSSTGRGLDYNLETLFEERPPRGSGGEGREYSLMGAMWDFYDRTVDGTDMVSVEVTQLWAASLRGGRGQFSTFWKELIDPLPQVERIALGTVMARERLGATPSAPADGTTYKGGAPLTFQWTAAAACGNVSGLRYSLIVVDRASGQVRLQSPWQPGTTFTTSTEQLRDIFVGADGPLTWAVLTRDVNAPVTGDYYGAGRILIDAYQP